MRRWSRAVAALCVVYLLALVVFHHHLEPRNNPLSDDYVDGRDYTMPAPLAASHNNSIVKHKDLRLQLLDLEEGMSKLEEEIFNVKVRLAEEALARKHEKERQEQEQQQQQQQEQQQQQQQQPQERQLQNIQVMDGDTQGRRNGVYRKHPNMNVYHVPMGNFRDLSAHEVESTPEENYNNSSLIKVGNGLAVYSAYHDDRLETAWVRLIVVLSGPKSKRRLLCHFENAGSGAAATTEAEQYEMCENHKKKYLGFIYSCRVPTEVKPGYKLHVSSLSSPADRTALSVLPVSPPGMGNGKVFVEQPRYKYNFSVCVSPLFGSVSAKRLVEFIEITRILGVQQIHFYDYHISSVVRRVLQYYGEKGWVTLLPWRLPQFMGPQQIWYQGQLISNNDCLYRTMATSTYTAFHDIDELIVPHATDARTLSEVVPALLPNDTCGFSFKSAFYDPGVATTFQDDLMTVALTARSSMISRVRTKVMVAPQRVFEVGIHHVSKQLLEPWVPRPMDPQVALLHHYRECIRDFGMRCDNWIKDTIIRDRFMPELKDNFARAIKTLSL